MLKEGCTWRAIPHDFPKWQNVRYHYDNWSRKDENGVSDIDRALQALVELEREREERDSHSTMLIVDSKSIQNADTGGRNGYDVGKKSGVKLHIGVDILGLPHIFAVIQKRWVVERSFGWLDKCRRVWKNCERLTHNTLQLISMAFIRIIANRYQTGSKNGADASPPRSVVSCLSYRGDGGKIVGELLPFQCILYIGFVVYLH